MYEVTLKGMKMRFGSGFATEFTSGFAAKLVRKELEVIQSSGYFRIADKGWWIYNHILVPTLSLDICKKTVPLASILLQITNVLEKRMQTRK